MNPQKYQSLNKTTGPIKILGKEITTEGIVLDLPPPTTRISIPAE